MSLGNAAPTARTGPRLLVLLALLGVLLGGLSGAPTLHGSAPARYGVSSGAAQGGANLGVFSLASEAASQGNVMTFNYGTSMEGEPLITYWGSPAIMNVVATGTGQYQIVEGVGNRCLTVNGTTLTINTCNSGTGQSFTLTPQTDGSFTIQAGTGNCLHASGAFVVIDAQPCADSPSQRWNFSGATPLTLTPSPTPVTTSPTIVNSPTVPAGYHLTFDDEFQALNISDTNGTGANWYTHTVQCCMYDTSNPSTPTYMAGITDPAGRNPYSLVPGGGLDIRLQKTNGAWYSGVIATVDQTGSGFAQQYGYFEMKAKFPPGQGTWPAFWLLNSAALSQHAPAGEIDVVESYMFAPTYVNTTLHDWSNSTTVGYKLSQTADLTNGFHIFGMLWTASTITFYVDGTVIYQLPTPAIMNQPYYPIIDLGIGGGWPTNNTPQQSDLIVQYMRVYAN